MGRLRCQTVGCLINILVYASMLDMSRHHSMLDCEPGVTRLFGEADIATQGLISGWSDPEEGHNWNDGPEAICVLSTKPPVTRLLLVLMGEPYVNRARPLQDVTLFGNGYRLGYWRLSVRAETALMVALEPEWWLTRGPRAILRLHVHVPNSIRPKDINDGPDGRELALCCRSICLRPISV